MNQTIAALLAQATQDHEGGRWKDAERGYRQILGIDPAHGDALHQLGLLAYQNGRNDIAVDLVSRALSRDPNRASFHNTMGSTLLATGDTIKAIGAFERAIALAPDSIEIRNNLANALQAQGRLGDAAAHYRALLAAAPGNADILHNLALTLHLQGDADAAISHFKSALAIKPNDALAHGNLASAYCTNRAFNDAVAACERAISLDPNLALVHNNLGNALCALDRLDEAISSYRRALAIAPKTAEVHKNLAVALHRSGRWEDADASLAAAIALDPVNTTFKRLRDTHRVLGPLEASEPAYRVALEAGDSDWLHSLGVALNDLGRHAQGLEAIARGPGVVRFSLDDRVKNGKERSNPLDASKRRNIPRDGAPTFIGSWFLEDSGLCERLIAFFEDRDAAHVPGRTSAGTNYASKRSTDLHISPKDLDQPGFEPIAAYLRELEACTRDYAHQWPHLGGMLRQVDLAPFHIQRYREGEHFQAVHSERMSFGYIHRVLAWMTYLNDVADGGETRFHHFDLAVRPERGKTLIWPAEWTHAHSGDVVTKGQKYIITGWMHFPHPEHHAPA